MLKANNIFTLFLLVTPFLIIATKEEKTDTTTTAQVSTKEKEKSSEEKIKPDELEKKEKIDFLKKKISLAEDELKNLTCPTEIKTKKPDLENAKKELASLTGKKNTFGMKAKEKLDSLKKEINNRPYLMQVGTALGVVSCVVLITYLIKTYTEKNNIVSAE